MKNCYFLSLKIYLSVLFSGTTFPPIHCLSKRFNIYFCNFQKLVPSKCNFFLWNKALRSGFRRLTRWQNREIKYTFVHFFPGIAEINTREIQFPNFRKINRLRVVSNFGDGDCGTGEINTRTREISRRHDANFWRSPRVASPRNFTRVPKFRHRPN